MKERRIIMMGFTDGWIALAYILCICSALLCVIYGVLNWNRGVQDENMQASEEPNCGENDI